MERSIGSIGHILKSAFSQYYTTENKVVEEIIEDNKLNPIIIEEEILEAKETDKTKKKLPNSARKKEESKSTKNNSKPSTPQLKEKSSKPNTPLVEVNDKPQTPLVDDTEKFIKTNSGLIPVENPELAQIEMEYSTRHGELNDLISYLKDGYNKRREFDKTYTQEMKTKGLIVNTDIPRIENPESVVVEFSETIPVIIGKKLVDDHLYKQKQRGGFIPTEIKEFEKINEEKHYLETTKCITEHFKDSIKEHKNKHRTSNQTNSITKPTKRFPVLTIDEDNKIATRMANKLSYIINPRYTDITLASANPRKILEISKEYLRTQEPSFERNSTGFMPFPNEIKFYSFEVNRELGDNITHRINILPPKTEYFCISNIQYPSDSSGDIAPGMSCRVSIRFMSDEYRDYSDEIIVISEMNQFIVKIDALIEKPILKYEKVVDFGCRLKGSVSESKIIVKNIGFSSTFNLNIKEEIAEYTFEPKEFYLDNNEEIEIAVCYSPTVESFNNYIIEIESKSYDIWKFEVKGKCEAIDVEWDAIDGIEIINNQLLRNSLYFETYAGEKTKKIVSIKNNNSFNFRYEWVFYNKDGISQGNISSFQVIPNTGYLETNTINEFIIEYIPSNIQEDTYKLGFHLKDIAKESYPKNNYFSLTFPSEEVNGSAIENVNVKHLEVELYGKSNPLDIKFSSNSLHYDNLSINYCEAKQIELINNTNVKSSYYWNCIPYYIELYPLCGEINPKEKIEFNISWNCSTHQLPPDNDINNIVEDKLICDVKNTLYSLNIDLKGVVTYPEIFINETLLDYKYVKTLNSVKKKLRIENKSSTENEIKLEIDQQSSNETNVVINPNNFILLPNEERSVEIVCIGGIRKEKYHKYLKITPKIGKNQYVEVKAEIQSPNVVLAKKIIDLRNIYHKVLVNGVIELINKSSIPTKYKFNSVIDKDEDLEFDLEKKCGIIHPNQTLALNFTLFPKKIGRIDKYYYFEIEGQEKPLGLKILSLCHSLSVGFEIFNEPPSETDKISEDSILPPKIELIEYGDVEINSCSKKYLRISNYSGIETNYEIKYEEYDYDSIFEIQDLKNTNIKSIDGTYSNPDLNLSKSTTNIKKTSSHVGFVKTLSKTTKRIKPLNATSQTSLIDNYKTRLSSTNNYLLSDAAELRTYFTSKTGQEYVNKKLDENVINQSLAGGRGIALRSDKPTGILMPWGSVVIEIILFSDLPGEYEDKLICNMEEIEPMNIRIHAHIIGSPLIISKDCVGLISSSYPYLMKFPSSLYNSEVVTKQFTVKNTSPRNISLKWEVQNSSALNLPYFNIEYEVNKVLPIKYDLKFNENTERYEPSLFTVDPANTVIPYRGKVKFKVSFKPSDVIGKFESLLIGHCAWERTEDVESKRKIPLINDWVKLKLLSNVTNPMISLTAKEISPSNYLVQYKVWSTSSIKDDTFKKTVTIRNLLDTNLRFEPFVKGPFVVENNKGIYNLNGFESVDVKLFYKPKKAEREIIKTSSIPKLDVVNNGSMLLQFNNGYVINVELRAKELCPFLCIEPSQIEFKVVKVDNKTKKNLYLMNSTEVTCNWKIINILTNNKNNTIDDPSAFSFNFMKGELIGPSYSLDTVKGHYVLPYTNTDKLPYTIEIEFSPKLNRKYESRYRIEIEKGESIDFQVFGEGTYDEI